MSAALPNLNEGPLAVGQLREDARRELIEALDSRRGKKVLVLDPRVSGFLGLLCEVSLLKEHGVEQLLHLSSDALGDIGVRNVVYLVRARVENAQQIAQQIKATHREKAEAGIEYAVYFLPRRTIACERIFQEQGVYGDIVAGELPISFIPFDCDVLSLEMGSAFRELAAEGDRSCLYDVAKALMGLQSALGCARVLKGKGAAAQAVRALLTRMRQELSPDELPPPGSGGIDEMILLDREIDVVTPMCTQLTYEGLIDETLQIKNGSVTTDGASGSKQRITLNSADRIYAELRDRSFAAVGPELRKRAMAIQSDYKTSKAAERSLTELKEFASQLKALPNIQRHISLAEAVNKAIAAPAFRAHVGAEQAMLDGQSADAAAEAIEESMCSGEDIHGVLRLMCLLSLTQGGIAKKHFDPLRREFLQSYGHEYLLLLSKLQDAGVLAKQEGKGHWAALKRAFRLLVDDVDDQDPADPAYVFSGHCPLTVRLVEAAVKGPGWGIPEDVLKLLPGPAFEVEQALDDKGLPCEKPLSEKKKAGAAPRKRKVVLVMFLGGVTFAEIAALRFLSSRPEVNCAFLVTATKLINGSSLLDSFVDDDVRDAKAFAELK